jgi:ABC-type glycerol-3-phosphate transport system substrate-binding protein
MLKRFIVILAASMMFAGCAHLSSTTTETTDSTNTNLVVRSTTVTVTTFFDANGGLTKFRNNATRTTTGTTIGSLSLDSSGTNVVLLLQAAAQGLATGIVQGVK